MVELPSWQSVFERRLVMKRWRSLFIALLAIAVVSVGAFVFVTHVGVAHAAAVSEHLVSPAALRFPKNKQNESPMAVNPTNPNNAISGANDEIEEPDCTPPTGSSSSCPFVPGVNTSGVYVTINGGATWSQQILHWNSSGLVSDGDPVVAFGPKPDGNGGFSYAHGARAYFGSLAGSPTFGPDQELVAVSFSDDGGMSWSAPVVATNRDNKVAFNDKIALWADANPSSPNFGNVYVSWTLFKGTGNFGESNTFSPEPITFTRSTNGGLSYENSQRLTQSANNGSVGGRQGSTIRSAPDGSVYVFWDGALQQQDAVLGIRSTDGGVHFGQRFLVAFKSSNPSPLPGASFRDNSFPQADIDGSGNLYVVWTNYTSGHGVVKLAKSTNQGASWTVSTAANVTGRSAFYPAVATAGANVFIGFNALDDVAAGTAPGAGVVFYDAYYVLSQNGGALFGGAVKISATSSDPDAASTNGLTAQFLGDYNGAATGSNGAFWFSWTDTRNGATCAAIDAWRASGFTITRPNIYDSCPNGFGNSDIFVATVAPPFP
jgi:hypothetical protein